MKKDMEINDVLIIGSGISGCCCALELADAGLNVVLLNKEEEGKQSNTLYAQGGIAGLGFNDTKALFKQDIKDVGGGLCYDAAIDVIVDDGARMLKEVLVNKLQIPFTKDELGETHYTSEGAHSIRRVHHVLDHTGKAIIEALIDRVRDHPNIIFKTGHIAIDLITRGHHSKDHHDIYRSDKCLGAYVLSDLEDEVKLYFAKKTVLATGGLGNIYLYTSNPSSATGDGVAMAYRAGASIINAEYIQFHPTTLFHRDADRFLITEALRGEGGRLYNARGEYFMKGYHEMGDLASRDIVSRAIYEQMYLTGKDYVFLDLKPLEDKGLDISKSFPTIYEKCVSIGIDPREEAIPVVPASHYFCGGIKVDLYGRTDIMNLYAVGEVSCTGVNGANRLASVSLLEGLVWGIRSAEDIKEGIMGVDINLLKNECRNIGEWEMGDGVSEKADRVLIVQDWLSIKTLMWNYVGIIRTKKRLSRAYADLRYLLNCIEEFYRETFVTKDLLELRNGILSANIVARAALRNAQSRGCHYRSD